MQKICIFDVDVHLINFVTTICNFVQKNDWAMDTNLLSWKRLEINALHFSN